MALSQRRPNRQVRPLPRGGMQRGDGRQWRPSIAGLRCHSGRSWARPTGAQDPRRQPRPRSPPLETEKDPLPCRGAILPRLVEAWEGVRGWGEKGKGKKKLPQSRRSRDSPLMEGACLPHRGRWPGGAGPEGVPFLEGLISVSGFGMGEKIAGGGLAFSRGCGYNNRRSSFENQMSK